MKPEAQRVAIAEACGEWPPKRTMSIEQIEAALADKRPTVVTMMPNGQVAALPDYLADLNAMHEAEKVLTPAQVPAYIDELWNVVGNTTASMSNFTNRQVASFMWRVHMATAAQRCEAFLKALNLWDDSK